jgi:hypothetical protein
MTTRRTPTAPFLMEAHVNAPAEGRATTLGECATEGALRQRALEQAISTVALTRSNGPYIPIAWEEVALSRGLVAAARSRHHRDITSAGLYSRFPAPGYTEDREAGTSSPGKTGSALRCPHRRARSRVSHDTMVKTEQMDGIEGGRTPAKRYWLDALVTRPHQRKRFTASAEGNRGRAR